MEWLCEQCNAAFGLDLELVVDHEEAERSDGNLQDVTLPSPKKARIDKENVLCQSCVGLLDPNYHLSIVDDVRRRFFEEGYSNLTSFQFCVHVPATLLLLQAALEHQIGGGADRRETGFVKEELKVLLSKLLETSLELKSTVNSPFQVLLSFDHQQLEEKSRELVAIAKGAKQQGKCRRVGQLTQAVIGDVVEQATPEHYEQAGLLLASMPLSVLCTYQVSFLHESFYLAGRYCKFSRLLSQTPWVVEGMRKTSSSVQELLCERLQEVVRASSVRFSSSGREDVDVRMLGNGRPFLLEFVNPRLSVMSQDECCRLQDAINSGTNDISVSCLTVVGCQASELLKAGEEEKQKSYSALVWASQALLSEDLVHLSKLKDIVIQQKTPLRVLHRRSLATRERTVFSLSGEVLDDHHFTLSLETQAGTYIKEFIHGDFGRTRPSLGEIMGQTVDILTLDVTGVGLNWPP